MNSAEMIQDDSQGRGSRKGPYSRCGDSSVWTPMNIAIMVLGFIFFTPIGLLVLFGLIMGVSPWQLPQKIASWFEQASDRFGSSPSRPSYRGRSGNKVFDEYQQTQLDRIEEIKTEVKERDQQFKTFKDDETRAKDKKQFDRFMGRDQGDE